MPSKVLEKYSKDSGKTLKETEAAWEKAKEEGDKFHKERDDLYWGYVNLRTRQILGLEESKKKKKK